ncbi:MAG: DUF4124 domain-containing protein [Betaproteobacteria bacterium]|nr:DUF4124 domain-containing protein [Betaproteobacteria bacterium]
MIRIFVGGAVLLLAAGAQAQLYSCKGDDGRIRFVSARAQCAGDIINNYSPAKTKKTKAAKAAKSGKKRGPGKFAKISPQKQRTLDKARGDVLLYELESEKKIKTLLDKLIGKTPPEETRRLAVLHKRRKEHALNITAIRQELARLGGYASYSGN